MRACRAELLPLSHPQAPVGTHYPTGTPHSVPADTPSLGQTHYNHGVNPNSRLYPFQSPLHFVISGKS